MSTVAITTQAEREQLHNARPSFFGMLGGELFKMSRRWSTWIFLVLLFGGMSMAYIVRFADSTLAQRIKAESMTFLYSNTVNNLGVFRVFSGFYLLIIVAYIIGLEYQLGTIRILLARGAGRLQLLCAKVAAAVIVALLLFVAAILFNVLATYALLLSTNNLNALNTINNDFWINTGRYALTVLLNMGVTILLATALSVLGRSLTFGLSAALIWFPIDNIGTTILQLIIELTKNTGWTKVSTYLLGPNLNLMPAAMAPEKFQVFPIGATPLEQVTGNHTLWVALVYSVIFAVVAIVFTWKRDVKE